MAVRFQIIAERAVGRCCREVAGQLHVAPSTVSRTANRYEELGIAGLFDQRQGNGATKAHERFHRELHRVLSETPDAYGGSRHTWTRELLRAEMERRGPEASEKW